MAVRPSAFARPSDVGKNLSGDLEGTWKEWKWKPHSFFLWRASAAVVVNRFCRSEDGRETSTRTRTRTGEGEGEGDVLVAATAGIAGH